MTPKKAAYDKAYREANREAVIAYQKKWREENREKISKEKKDYYLKNRDEILSNQKKNWSSRTEEQKVQSFARQILRKYGLSLEDYALLEQAQGGGCKICLTKPTGRRRLAVDHNHRTGKIRGLLCDRCNLLLGNGADSASLLRSAAAYLEISDET